jgi:lipid A ethanolaminephosphotransferase
MLGRYAVKGTGARGRAGMPLIKPELRYDLAVYGLAAYFVFVLNGAFWRRLYAVARPVIVYDWAFLAAVALMLWLVTTLAVSVIAVGRLFKPIAALLLIVSAAAGYFMREFGTVIDSGMIINVLQTDRAEAGDLMTWRLIGHVALWGVLPAVLLAKLPYQRRPLLTELKRRTVSFLAIVSAIVIVAYPFFMNLTSVFREHNILRHELLPFNIIGGLSRVVGNQARLAKPRTIKAFGTDAAKGDSWSKRGDRSVTVLVIGETARAQNFSLSGYARETNPKLKAIDGLVSFPKVMSCGTATAQSLPCLFSGLGQGGAGHTIALEQEGLLDILQRAGLTLLWRDNQGGCKGICVRIPTESIALPEPKKFYELAVSHDDRLLDGVQAWIDQLQGHGVVVLHMIGSHGPAYFKRYPEAFEQFKPACKETQFSRCTREAIVNAYDNSIVFTDHVLASLIGLLAANDARGIPAAMTYVSDHGESLGENGIYLHGLPYALAPNEQKHVPWLWWLSPGYQRVSGVTAACLKARAAEALTHDNFFHSVLGLLDIRTTTRNPRLDVTAACRG